MTLVISASSALKNPLPDTPSIPDITSDLYFDFNAADLALADGATVNNWVGQGSAPIANRTLNTHNSISSWAFPTFDADGGPGGTPTVRFNGTNQRLRTTDANVTPISGTIPLRWSCQEKFRLVARVQMQGGGGRQTTLKDWFSSQ